MSDTEYGKEQQDEDYQALGQAVSEVEEVLLLEQEIEADVDRKIAAITADGVEKMKVVIAERDRLLAIVVPLYLRLVESDAVKGKTITVPSGQVSARLVTGTDVFDKLGLIKMMRRLRKLGKMSKRSERTVDVKALGVLMDSDPGLAAKIEAAGLAKRSTRNRLTIKPNSSNLKLEQDLRPDDRVVVLVPTPPS